MRINQFLAIFLYEPLKSSTLFESLKRCCCFLILTWKNKVYRIPVIIHQHLSGIVINLEDMIQLTDFASTAATDKPLTCFSWLVDEKTFIPDWLR